MRTGLTSLNCFDIIDPRQNVHFSLLTHLCVGPPKSTQVGIHVHNEKVRLCVHTQMHFCEVFLGYGYMMIPIS